MNRFAYYKRTHILFGEGTHMEAGKQASMFGKKVMLVHCGTPALEPVCRDVKASLAAEDLEVVELGNVLPNPRLSKVREGIALAKETGVQFILALGGGSAIDTAKAVAVGAYHDVDVWDFFTKKAPLPKRALPLGAVLTIPAAGSESSDGSVITDAENTRKLSLNCSCLMPAFAILDPALCVTLPRYQLQVGVCDIITHVLERYFTNTTHTDYGDMLCEATLRSVMNSARVLLRCPQDVNAWGELMWAGNIAHNGILGMGREEDWASHDIEHEISAEYDIAHGAGLAIVFPAWMRYVYKDNVPMFAQFAARVFDVDASFDNLEEMALEGIRRFERFLRDVLELPTTFTQAGLPCDAFARMAERACLDGPRGRFRRLYTEDVQAIYELAR